MVGSVEACFYVFILDLLLSVIHPIAMAMLQINA